MADLRRPLLATHLIWGCYGFWLPNDPRGSWSKYVGSQPLYDLGGNARTVDTRRSLAQDRHDSSLRRRTKRGLQRPPVRMTGEQAREVARTFGRAFPETGLVLFACSIMPDHVHVVAAPHAKRAAEIMGYLKSRASRHLRETGHNFGGTPWVKGGWAVYLFDETSVERAIRYVKSNPIKAGLRPQRWSFVEPYPR
jgi:REP element-mobilizing transposase RayT